MSKKKPCGSIRSHDHPKKNKNVKPLAFRAVNSNTPQNVTANTPVFPFYIQNENIVEA